MTPTRWMAAILPCLVACSGSEEAQLVTLPVTVDGAGVAVCTNDLGYEIEVTSFRVAIRDLEMTIGGEAHASVLQWLSDVVVPEAHAHPGHYAGGEITGELPGSFVVDFVADDGDSLGDASLLEGLYHGLNFSFRAAGAADELEAGDPLSGHTVHIEGSATKDGTTLQIAATLDIDEGTQIVGAPFDLDVEAGERATLGLQILTIDPFEGDTIFDGLDFGALDDDADGQVEIAPGQPAHNLFRRTVQVHDHYFLHVEETP